MPQVILVGDSAARGMRALLDVVRRRYLPTTITVPVDSTNRERLDRVLPWMAAMTARDGRPTAYVCRDFSCQAPTTEARELDGQLSDL